MSINQKPNRVLVVRFSLYVFNEMFENRHHKIEKFVYIVSIKTLITEEKYFTSFNAKRAEYIFIWVCGFKLQVYVQSKDIRKLQLL